MHEGPGVATVDARVRRQRTPACARLTSARREERPELRTSLISSSRVRARGPGRGASTREGAAPQARRRTAIAPGRGPRGRVLTHGRATHWRCRSSRAPRPAPRSTLWTAPRPRPLAGPRRSLAGSSSGLPRGEAEGGEPHAASAVAARGRALSPRTVSYLRRRPSAGRSVTRAQVGQPLKQFRCSSRRGRRRRGRVVPVTDTEARALLAAAADDRVCVLWLVLRLVAPASGAARRSLCAGAPSNLDGGTLEPRASGRPWSRATSAGAGSVSASGRGSTGVPHPRSAHAAAALPAASGRRPAHR